VLHPVVATHDVLAARAEVDDILHSVDNEGNPAAAAGEEPDSKASEPGHGADLVPGSSLDVSPAVGASHRDRVLAKADSGDNWLLNDDWLLDNHGLGHHGLLG